MEEVKIFEQQLNDKCKFAILVGGLCEKSPANYMNNITCKYTNGVLHNQFIDIKMNNPWTRVILSDIRKLPFEDFSTFLKKKERKEKLNKIKKHNEK